MSANPLTRSTVARLLAEARDHPPATKLAVEFGQACLTMADDRTASEVAADHCLANADEKRSIKEEGARGEIQKLFSQR